MDSPKEEKKAVVSHGFVTHGIEECETCEDCIKCKEDFERARSDGTLDKILATSSLPQNEGMEERFKKKYKEIIKNAQTVQGAGGYIYSAIPTKKVLELKHFISQEISLAKTQLIDRILEKQTIGYLKILNKDYKVVSVEDILAIRNEEGV